MDDDRPAGLILTTILVMGLVVLHSLPSWGQELPGLAGGIAKLQPALLPSRAVVWERQIIAADTEAGIGDPWLLAAMVMRESSYREDVASGARRGALGERGPLQVWGAALRYLPDDCDRGAPSAQCLLRTGARWLARRRQDCPGSTWRWAAAYGTRACPTESSARRMRHARRAWQFYQVIRPGHAWGPL